MNNARRAKLELLNDRIQNIVEELQEICDEEQGAHDGLPDSLQSSAKGETMQNNVNCMEEAIDLLNNAQETITNAKE